MLDVLVHFYTIPMLETSTWPLVAAGLEHADPAIVTAALQCARLAGRNLRYVRLCIAQSGASKTLVGLLGHDVGAIQQAACLAVANLAAHASQMKKQLMEDGAVEALGALLGQPDDELQAAVLQALAVCLPTRALSHSS